MSKSCLSPRVWSPEVCGNKSVGPGREERASGDLREAGKASWKVPVDRACSAKDGVAERESLECLGEEECGWRSLRD